MIASESSYINTHTHYKPGTNEMVVRNAYLKLNAPQLSELPYMVSVGLHPWHINKYNLTTCTDLLMDVVNLSIVFAVGEIGIDRAIDVPISTQMQYFEAQLNIARAVQKPVIIHAVKSYSDLMPFLKKTKVPFIFHGFTGNIQQAKEMLKYNAYLSFGKILFEEKYQDVLAQIPNDRFLLETDSAKISINQIYDLAANAKAIEVDELKSLVFNTFAAITK